VGVGVIFPGAVMVVHIRIRIKRGQLLQPDTEIVVESPLIIVDEHAAGDVHGIDKHHTFPDTTFPYRRLHVGSDVHKPHGLRKCEGDVLGMVFHLGFSVEFRVSGDYPLRIRRIQT
jgi:hypothetical protein